MSTTPVTTRRPCSSSDHSYELRLLLLLDLLDALRFIAGVLLDRLGVAPGDVRLPGELLDAAAAERYLEAAWRTTAPRFRRRPPADGGRGAEDVCAICFAGLELGAGGGQVAELCSCSHAFHAACIEAWVCSGEAAATCPLCRAPV